MMLGNKTILILAPHTDDGELGCGGAISAINREGTTTYYVAFSSCELSVPAGFSSDILRKEVIEATGRLGICKENVFVERFEVRTFSEHRQKILERMIFYRRELNPDVVFVPSMEDVHQDHETIRSEAIRAFKNCTILGYELPWNNFSFAMQFFFNLSEAHINTKLDALAAYKSQGEKSYFQQDFIKGWARLRGVQAGLTYAEAFQVIRFIHK